MKEIQQFERLEQASGTNAKLALLQEFKGNDSFSVLLEAALNFRKKFFINKFDDVHGNPGKPVDLHARFVDLLALLKSRQIVGDRAREHVNAFLMVCTELQAKWYARIIRKDLKIGIGVDLANKAGYNIPVFDVQLAKDGKKTKNVELLIKKGCFASAKLDGYRCIAVKEGDDVLLYSRNGTPFQNFPSIANSLSRLFNALPDNAYVFDGEIMSNDFNKMQQSAFASKRGTVVGDVAYCIFDMIRVEEWETDHFMMTASQRYAKLEKWFKETLPIMQNLGINNIKLIPHFKVTSMAEVLDMERQFTTEGYEGVIVNTDIPYYRGRSSNKMMKFKTMQSFDCRVVSVYAGDKGSKYKDTLGGLIVTQENGQECGVGSGFTDAERDYIWNNPKEAIGRVAEIKFQELSQDKIMRFPIFMRWRNEKV